MEFSSVRPLNCSPKLGIAGKDGAPRCPHCGLWHLRAGYCQALDPIYAVDKPVDTGSVDTSVDKRKEYQREWARRKRAGDGH